MRVIYYHEMETGEYLAAFWGSYTRDGCVEGRACAVTGNVRSVCTTAISPAWLREKCKRVAKRNVPREWLDAIG